MMSARGQAMRGRSNFTVDDDEYSDLNKMHSKLLEFVMEVNRVVEEDGWNASAVQEAIGAIDWYIARSYKKFQGYLLSGLVEREEAMEMELLLPKNVREVSY
jgi:hypothetical protein